MTMLPKTSHHRRMPPARRSLTQRVLAARIGPLHGVGLWGSIAAIVAFLAIAIPQYGQPYVMDEAVFPYVADGIAKNGAPFFYNGEFRPNDLGLWHPPLYDYLLSVTVRIFGTSPYSVRAFGSATVIASLFFLVPALKRIAPGMKQYGYAVMAAVFLLNPLTISDSLIPDIDGTLGVLEVTIAVWLSTIVARTALSWRLVLGVFIFATVASFTKFEIAAIVAIIIGCSALISPVHRWLKFLWAVIAFIAGAALSLVVLFALGAILKFDARAPFDYLFASLATRTPGRSGLSGMLANLTSGPGSNLIWIGPAIILAAVVTFITIFIVKPADVSRSLAGLTVVSSLLIIGAYSYITASPFGFPKYTAVVVPGLSLVTTLMLMIFGPALPIRSKGTKATTRGLLIAYAVVLLVGVGGIFLILRRFERIQSRDLSELIPLTVADFVCVAIATFILAYLLVSPDSTSVLARLRRALAIGLVAAIVFTPIMVQVSSSLVNLASPFSTRYFYRERGMAEFLSRADKIVPSAAKIISPKDVGLQLDRRYYEDAALLPLTTSQLRTELTTLHAPYLVTRSLYDYSEVVFPAQFVVLRQFYKPVLSGPNFDFTLWKLK